MKRIETVQEALAAANQALDLVKAIQAAKIRGIVVDEAIDVSFASARADLEFVCHSLAKLPSEGCSHSSEDGARYCQKCGVPLPYAEKSK